MKESIIRTKSFDFALEIIELYKDLHRQKSEYTLSRQLLKCGTSIGANVEEAQAAISKRDFRNKMSISLKESRETLYWLKLLTKSDFIEPEKGVILITNCEELVKILYRIVKNTKPQ